MRALAPIQKVDFALSSLCLGHRFNREVATCSRWISHSGDGHMYLAVGVLLALLGGDAGVTFFFTALVAFALELPAYILLKRLFRRNRPSHIPSFITPSDRYSMPSGHTAAACLMATLLSHYFPSFAVIYWTWAGCIGLSRVLLGVHFFSDIVAGTVLGIGSAILVLDWAVV
ncbi:phosphatase PAP2 family protein [Parasalinivibrio latis]|uniref:phosphatase PAP2 family protein n=1 Tax=Parasalinivibrio latis TaxID=2952610 RepID=UPI0030E2E30A